MSGKMCPIYSTDQKRDCAGDECMLFLSSASGGACGLVKAPQQLADHINTLSAQIQEIQVAIIKLTDA